MSGALDTSELAVLYNDNGVMVSENEVKRLYGSENVNFTLKMFENMTKNKESLRNYRQYLKSIRQRLQ